MTETARLYLLSVPTAAPERATVLRVMPVTDAAQMAGLLGSVAPTEHNPRGIAVHHRTATALHRCSPNVVAVCRSCRHTFALCTATGDEYAAIRAETWVCGPCTGGAA